jgi:hypothetical protein
MSSQQDELDQLRKRARRRLVGAIVMSLIAGGVMLRVLDSKPQHEMRPETVDIVSNLPGQQPAKPAGEAAATAAQFVSDQQRQQYDERTSEQIVGSGKCNQVINHQGGSRALKWR